MTGSWDCTRVHPGAAACLEYSGVLKRALPPRGPEPVPRAAAKRASAWRMTLQAGVIPLDALGMLDMGTNAAQLEAFEVRPGRRHCLRTP